MNRTLLYSNMLVKQISEDNITVQYPQLVGLQNKRVQSDLNKQIESIVKGMIKEQTVEDLQIQEMTGKFDIKINKNNIISLVFTNYTFWEHAAHGLTLQKSLTANVSNGKIYKLKDLFRPNSYYKTKLTSLIKKQIKTLDIPTIEPFVTVKNDDDFYLTTDDLVIYYPIYEYTPYYVNIPEFNIPYSETSDIISPTGPIPLILLRK